jgi:hypothetical protein
MRAVAPPFTGPLPPELANLLLRARRLRRRSKVGLPNHSGGGGSKCR